MVICVGVFRLCVDLPDEQVENCYLNKERLDSYDERIFGQLQKEAGNNQTLHVPYAKIPAFKIFFKFWEEHEIEINLTDSVGFQTTCKYFALDELENCVKTHFGRPRNSSIHS